MGSKDQFCTKTLCAGYHLDMWRRASLNRIPKAIIPNTLLACKLAAATRPAAAMSLESIRMG